MGAYMICLASVGTSRFCFLVFFALRGGGSGLELTLHVLINLAWLRYQ
ncbi:hypothetical protein T11_1586 [Trichinella zimbabwensis]|uniref:Uncharacterized protein n=1 Tax=Trichinella zimbabwensis TaxID=268475 RepID=A0A0V1GHK0_9BILA|nr:hypothetical protein T11_1586 [Trichinella zimbabwensis]